MSVTVGNHLITPNDKPILEIFTMNSFKWAFSIFERMNIKVFQNAEIVEKKISQAPYFKFHPILSQDPKDF